MGNFAILLLQYYNNFMEEPVLRYKYLSFALFLIIMMMLPFLQLNKEGLCKDAEQFSDHPILTSLLQLLITLFVLNVLIFFSKFLVNEYNLAKKVFFLFPHETSIFYRSILDITCIYRSAKNQEAISMEPNTFFTESTFYFQNHRISRLLHC